MISIQPSVTIWTILCFVALMLILDRLLFRPLLSFMDKRREKIDGAKQAKADALSAREEELRQREEDRIAAEKRAMTEANAALEEVRRENAARLTEKKAQNDASLAALREELDAESAAILAALDPRVETMARSFADRLRSLGDEAEEAPIDEVAAPRAPLATE